MTTMPFDKVSFLYDFVETHILHDYQGSIALCQQYLEVYDDDRVLDLGGGTGFFSQFLAKRVQQVVTFDSSRKMLRKNRFPSMTNIQGYGQALPFQDECFDLVVLVHVLHHIPTAYQQHVIDECFRVVIPSGRVFVIEVFFPQTFWNKVFSTIEDFFVGKTDHIAAETLHSYLTAGGFENIMMTNPQDHSWKYVAIGYKK